MASSLSCNVEETPMSRKRKRSPEQSDGTDTGDSLENESPNSATSSESRCSIPIDISNWKEEHIQKLSVMVQYEENTTPSDLLEDHILRYMYYRKSDNYTLFQKMKICDKFEKYFLEQSLFHEILDDDLDSLSRVRAANLRTPTCYSTKQFIDEYLGLGPKQSNPQYIAEWCQRFEAAGVQFAKCLYFTVIKRDLDIIEDDDDGTRKEPLTEYDFQFLFEAFTSIFNLQGFNWIAPLLRSKTLSLSQGKAAGKTDIIYCQDIGINVEMPLCSMKNIVAICEVKKYNNQPQQLDPVVTRKGESSRVSNSSSSTQKSLPPHMSLAELGQLGGELLLYSQQSFAKDVIFGIFVQETKVSFAVLKITPEEYNGILTGNLAKTNPKLIITRPFDYMKKEDRKYLVKPLLRLSIIQEQIFGKD